MIKISKRATEMQPSATLVMAARAKAMKADGVDVISFEAGEPDFDTPAHICEAGVRGIEEGLTRYTPSSGMPELKAAIREKLRRDNDLAYTDAEITVTCGAKQALYNALQVLVDPGDEVIVPAPYWVSYPDQIKLAGGVPVIAETDAANAFKVTVGDLAKAITGRTRTIILNYPSNPTGSTYAREELRELGTFLAKKGIVIISDEIYEKLVYGDTPHASIATACPESKTLTLVINGVSKAYAMTGWRMGFAAGPAEIISKMSELAGQQNSGIPGFVQKACAQALCGPQDEVERMRLAFSERRKAMYEWLVSIPGIRCHLPEGAFYLLPNVSAFFGRTINGKRMEHSDDMAAYLLEKAHVATVSGTPFGAPGYIRLSYATSQENIKKGIERMREALSPFAEG
jgi:aspartate aminotransferase